MLILALTCSLFSTAAENKNYSRPTSVFIVAGQSNILNWHANAAELNPDPVDNGIAFYHLSGAPPDRGFTTPINATSHGRWINLSPQRQEPFVRYERDFFGPEITLSRRLAQFGVTPLAIIKIGFFGTNLANDWHPRATTGNQLYARLLREIGNALRPWQESGRAFQLAGIFWMQGETDAANHAFASAYATNLHALITSVRSDLDAPGLPFILGRVGPRPPRDYLYQETVRSAQSYVPTTLPATSWVDTDDLSRDSDGIHLLAAGVAELGERWADAWMQTLRYPVEFHGSSPPPSPTTKTEAHDE